MMELLQSGASGSRQTPRGNGKNTTAVAKGVLSRDGSQLDDVQVIFQQQPP